MEGDELDRAVRLEREGDLDGALLLVEEALARSPDNAFALARLARIQLRRNRLEEAEAAIDRAEDAAGTSAFSAQLRGDLCYRMRRYEEAARAYKQADALGANGSWVLLQLARARLQLGDLEGAKGAAAQALERDPDSSSPLVLLGDVALREGCLDEAETFYERAHEKQPDDQWAYAKLVEVRLTKLPQERRDKEVEILLKSSGRGNRHLMGVLARMRSQRGQTSEAAETWAARASEHDDPFARKMYGFALRRAGKLDEAAAVLGRCLLEDPHDVVLFRTYVSLQQRRGALAELRQVLEEALPRAGHRRGAFYNALRNLPQDGDGGGATDPGT